MRIEILVLALEALPIEQDFLELCQVSNRRLENIELYFYLITVVNAKNVCHILDEHNFVLLKVKLWESICYSNFVFKLGVSRNQDSRCALVIDTILNLAQNTPSWEKACHNTFSFAAESILLNVSKSFIQLSIVEHRQHIFLLESVQDDLLEVHAFIPRGLKELFWLGEKVSITI